MLTLANGKQLTVTANNPRKNIYIDKVELNGKAIDVNYITYAQLMEGGELRFTLTDTPNTGRGTSAEAAPYSYTNEATVSIPYVDKDLNLFLDKVSVTLATTTAGAQIHYTLDGTEPTEESPVYTQPIELTRTTQLKAKGFKDGFRPSRTLSMEATKAELKPALSVHPTQNGTSYQYYEGLYQCVADIANPPLIGTRHPARTVHQGCQTGRPLRLYLHRLHPGSGRRRLHLHDPFGRRQRALH